MSLLNSDSLVKQIEFIGLKAVELLLYDADSHDIVQTYTRRCLLSKRLHKCSIRIFKLLKVKFN